MGKRITSRLSISVVAASNLDSRYLSCVPLFINKWKQLNKTSRHKYEPIVYLIADSLPTSLSKYSENIVLFNGLDIPSGFQAQNIRLLACSAVASDLAMMSDIDMLPLSPNFFDAAVDQFEFGTFYILRDILPPGEIMICYNIAQPETFREMLHINSSDIRRELFRRWEDCCQQSGYESIHGGKGWGYDQRYLYQMVQNFDQTRIRKLGDNKISYRRIDRSDSLPLTLRQIWLGEAPKMTDYHVHHPVKLYEPLINRLVNPNSKSSIQDLSQLVLMLPVYVLKWIFPHVKWKLKKTYMNLLNIRNRAFSNN